MAFRPRWSKRVWAVVIWTVLMTVALSFVEHSLAGERAKDCAGGGCTIIDIDGMLELAALVGGILLWGAGCGLIAFIAWLVADELPRRRRLNAVVARSRSR